MGVGLLNLLMAVLLPLGHHGGGPVELAAGSDRVAVQLFVCNQDRGLIKLVAGVAAWRDRLPLHLRGGLQGGLGNVNVLLSVGHEGEGHGGGAGMAAGVDSVAVFSVLAIRDGASEMVQAWLLGWTVFLSLS
jgi:hypothetical protein